MPDFERLFKQVGVDFKAIGAIDFGAFVRHQKIMNHPKIGSAAYDAGLQKEDKIIKIDTISFEGNVNINTILNTFKVGDTIKITYERYGFQKETSFVIKADTFYDLDWMDLNSKGMNKPVKEKRDNWLMTKL